MTVARIKFRKTCDRSIVTKRKSINKRMRTNIILFLIFLSAMMACGNSSVVVATSLRIPTDTITVLGVKQPYTKIIPIVTAPAVDICNLHAVFNTSKILKRNKLALEFKNQVVTGEWNIDCASFFCSGGNSTADGAWEKVNLGGELMRYRVNDEVMSTLAAVMYNYCGVCHNRTEWIPLEEEESCALFNRLDSLAERKMCTRGRAVLHTNHKMVNVQKREVFACLCDETNPSSYGFDCGRYSRVFLRMGYYAEPVIFVPLLFPIILYQIIYILIPYFAQWKYIIRDEALSPWRKIAEILNIRFQASVILFVSSVLLFVAQPIAILYPLTHGDDKSILRVLVGLMDPLCYALVLIHWAHACRLVLARDQLSEEEQRLSWFHTIFAAALYIFVIGILLITFILTIAKLTNIAYFIGCAAALIFVIAFPFGFTVYALIIYGKVRKLQKNSKSGLLKFKFTRFMLVANLVYTFVIIMIILYAMTFIVSWDALGLFVGVARTIIIDFVLVIMQVMMCNMLADERLIEKTYGERIGDVMNCTCFSSKSDDENTKQQQPTADAEKK